MIHGLLYWDDRQRYYSQVNNSIERLLRTKGDKGWLETCGPTATVMILDMMGRQVGVDTVGSYHPQPEDVLALWLNDPRNRQKMRNARPELEPFQFPGNQIAQYYPPAVAEVFGIQGEYIEGGTWEVVKLNLIQGHGVMVAMKSPGHFISVVAYDNLKDEFIYHDPFPKNSDGFAKRIRHQDYSGFIKPYVVAYM